MWDQEYNDLIKKAFKGNSNVMLRKILGLRNEGYELRLQSKYNFVIDIFIVYELDDKFQWNGYHNNRHLFRFVYSF